MTVDEILTTGEYTDRRGRVWTPSDNPGMSEWFGDIPDDPLDRAWWCSPKEMRLLIERDIHRGECEGIRKCHAHPVPHVVILECDDLKFKGFMAYPPGRPPEGYLPEYDTLPAALDAARALAVGE